MKLLLLVIVFVAVNSAPLDPNGRAKEEAKEEVDTSTSVTPDVTPNVTPDVTSDVTQDVTPDSFTDIFHEKPVKIEYPVSGGAVAGHFSGEFPAVVYQM